MTKVNSSSWAPSAALPSSKSISKLFSRAIKHQDQRPSRADRRCSVRLHLLSWLLPRLQLLVDCRCGRGGVQHLTRQHHFCHSSWEYCGLWDSDLWGSGHRLTSLRLHDSVGVCDKYVKELDLVFPFIILNSYRFNLEYSPEITAQIMTLCLFCTCATVSPHFSMWQMNLSVVLSQK